MSTAVRFAHRVPRQVAVTVMWLWVLFGVFIYVWLILGSVKTTQQIFTAPWGLPSWPLQWGNFVAAWASSELGTAVINSVLIVGVSTIVIVGLGAAAAYALTRCGLRFAEPLTIFFAVGIGIPGQAIVIPLFLLLADLQLIDTQLGLIITYVSLALPFTVFLLTGFFLTPPTELEEAASLDGASPWQTFVRIMLPLARPGLITAAILNVVSLWNEFFFALVLFNGPNGQTTLPVAIVDSYSSLRFTGNWAPLFAEMLIVTLPILFLYFWLSNRIIEGLTLGMGK